MKKKQFLFTFMAAVAVIALSWIFSKSLSSENIYSSLVLQNIEALTEGDDFNTGSLGTCTRVKRSHPCYRRDNWGINQFVCMAIDEVETYERHSVVEVCTHVYPTTCPS